MAERPTTNLLIVVQYIALDIQYGELLFFYIMQSLLRVSPMLEFLFEPFCAENKLDALWMVWMAGWTLHLTVLNDQ